MMCRSMLKPLTRCTAVQRYISYQKLKNWYGSLIKPKPQGPPYKYVTQIGDPVLRSVAEPIPTKLINSPETAFLISCMKYVFLRYKCVGLSAPQIGIPLRVLAIEFNEKHLQEYTEEERKNRDMDLLPFTVLCSKK